MVIREKFKNRKIGVLCGGTSPEKEISIKSGKAIYNALKAKDYKAVLIQWEGNLAKRILEEGIDLAFLVLHGRPGEDGTVQGLMEVLGIPYTGSGVKGSVLAMDKIITKKLFLTEGIPTPKFIYLSRDEKFHESPLFPFPWVVKPSSCGSTVGVNIIQGIEELEEAKEKAFSFDKKILIEEYIPGKEITLGILKDIPLPLIEIIPEHTFYDYHSKYHSKKTQYILPAPIENFSMEKIRELGLKAFNLLGCSTVGRVDMRLKGEEVFLMEVNSIPGMTETSLLPKAAKFAGIEFPELVEIILEDASLKGE